MCDCVLLPAETEGPGPGTYQTVTSFIKNDNPAYSFRKRVHEKTESKPNIYSRPRNDMNNVKQEAIMVLYLKINTLVPLKLHKYSQLQSPARI